MSKYEKLTPKEIQDVNHRIDQRWGQLYELEKESVERAFRYLLFTNSGGAIATLSFLGASTSIQFPLGVKTALLLFVLGIIIVGVSNAMQYHFFTHIFNAYKQDVDTFYKNKNEWADLISNDSKRSVERCRDITVAYLSFGCFILGCAVGAFSLFS